MRLPFIEPLLETTNVSGLGGEPLEWLTKVVLAFALAQTTTGNTSVRRWGEVYSFFRDSKLAHQEPISLDVRSPVSFLPKIMSQGNQKGEDAIKELVNNPKQIWRTTATREDWPAINKHLFHPNTIGHPAPKSNSPDILFNSENVMFCFANKLNVEDNAISWRSIEEEIEKASPLCNIKPVCLVITAIHLGQEVLSCLVKGPYIVISEGQWLGLVICYFFLLDHWILKCSTLGYFKVDNSKRNPIDQTNQCY